MTVEDDTEFASMVDMAEFIAALIDALERLGYVVTLREDKDNAS